MGKRVLIALLWGLTVWMLLSLAAMLLTIPDIGPIGGALTALGIVVHGMTTHKKPVELAPQLADAGR
jgi:hypothetical protein